MLDSIESLVESAMETFADMESHDGHMIADSYQRLQVFIHTLLLVIVNLLSTLGAVHNQPSPTQRPGGRSLQS